METEAIGRRILRPRRGVAVAAVCVLAVGGNTAGAHARRQARGAQSGAVTLTKAVPLSLAMRRLSVATQQVIAAEVPEDDAALAEMDAPLRAGVYGPPRLLGAAQERLGSKPPKTLRERVVVFPPAKPPAEMEVRTPYSYSEQMRVWGATSAFFDSLPPGVGETEGTHLKLDPSQLSAEQLKHAEAMGGVGMGIRVNGRPLTEQPGASFTADLRFWVTVYDAGGQSRQIQVGGGGNEGGRP